MTMEKGTRYRESKKLKKYCSQIMFKINSIKTKLIINIKCRICVIIWRAFRVGSYKNVFNLIKGHTRREAACVSWRSCCYIVSVSYTLPVISTYECPHMLRYSFAINRKAQTFTPCMSVP